MSVPPDLGQYLASPDDTVRWQLIEDQRDRQIIWLRSQTWHGIPWEHDVVIAEPPKGRSGDLCILYITGGTPNPADWDEARKLASLSGAPVAHLFQIPVQPLLGEYYEDDLIAETFVRFLDTGDSTWPLLFPMTKAAIKAMDAIQDINPGIKRFLVTGASKRGWTTWLVAATQDERCIAIAPMVIDNLNIGAQLQHQVQTWSAPSEMISPYTSRGLHDRIHSVEGERLACMVDPFSYRGLIAIPKLIINGTNDLYWAVDALRLYWSDLSDPKWACVIPNVGHNLGDKDQALRAIAALARSASGAFSMPQPEIGTEIGGYLVDSDVHSPRRVRLWIAQSENTDFRASHWREELVLPGHLPTYVELPESHSPLASLIELEYEIDGLDFRLSSPVLVNVP